MNRRVSTCALMAMLLLATPALAQQGTTEVRGRVVDSQGAILPGVNVTVRNQDTGMFRETTSTADGTYFVSGIVPGTYEIVAELQGFKKYSRRDVRLEIGKTATLDIDMAVGGLEETVTVSAESPIVDVTSKEVGGSVSSRELVELPSVNRNFVGFVGLLPGVIPSISTESFGSDSVTVNGQDARNNNYMLDGANNNDDVIGQRAGTQARTPIEAVQEFQVLTNQFDAEFGRTNGAIINAVTKQGTNAFRGTAFAFFQDAGMTAETYFVKKSDTDNLTKPETSQQQFGGVIGGPIVQNRAHFFGSVERVRADEGIAVVIPARPDLNGSTTEETRVWNTIARFDHQVTPSNTWGVRWLREYSPQFNQIIDPAANTLAALGNAREEDDLDQTVVASLNTVLGNTRVNTLRLGWTQEDVTFANACFNGNGRDQAACHADTDVPDVRRSTERRGAGARQRCVPDRRHAVVVPARLARRSRRKGRRAVAVLAVAQRHAGQLERDVHVRDEQRAVRRRQPAHLPGSVLDSRSRTWWQLQQVEGTSPHSCRTSGS